MVRNNSSGNIYHRQELLDNWNQSAWSNARIAVIGASTLANVVNMGLTVLGAGKLYSYSSDIVTDIKDEFLYFRSRENKLKAEELKAVLPSLNSDISIIASDSDLEYKCQAKLLGAPNIIIDLTNSPESKLIALEHGAENNIPVITASAASYSGSYSALYNGQQINELQLFPEYEGCEQGIIPSFVIGGLVIREATGLLMPRPREEPLEEIIHYSLSSDFRFLHYPLQMESLDAEALVRYNLGISKRISIEELQARQLNINGGSNLEEYKPIIKDFFSSAGSAKTATTSKVKFKNTVLAVGMGALGNPSTTALALSGIKRLVLLDPDMVESTNLHRQFLFCFNNSVDRPKVEVAAEVLSEIAPDLEIESIIGGLGLNSDQLIQDLSPDILLLGVDAFKWESLANRYSLRYNIPAVYGGTKEDRSGRVAVVSPEKTACLNHQVRIDDSALAQYQPARCILAPTPSVVTNNLIIGGAMAGECGPISRPEVHRNLLRGVIKYTSRDSSRICMMPSARSCECDSSEGRWEHWLSQMSHLYP